MNYKVLSLFSNVGFGEFYLNDLPLDVVVANELEQDRANFYNVLHPSTKMINGDITDSSIRSEIISECKKRGPIDIVMATPPCQGMSLANATKSPDDERNTLIIHAMDLFKEVGAKYMLIENVPNMPNTYISHKDYDEPVKILDFINDSIPEGAYCVSKVLNGKNFGTAQERKRSITLISTEYKWDHPEPDENILCLDDVIRDEVKFPSLDEDSSDIPWHFLSKQNPRHIDWMKYTPSGKSAYFNEKDHYPCHEEENKKGSGTTITEYVKKTNGENGWHTNPPVLIDEHGVATDAPFTEETIDGKELLVIEIPEGYKLKREIYGFTTAYKRMDWYKPSTTVTMTNGSISSQNNVHPGKENGDGTYSDARVFSIRELLAVCGLPIDLLDEFCEKKKTNEKYKYCSGNWGYQYHPTFIRKVLGEMFLPKMALEIMKTLPLFQENKIMPELKEETFKDFAPVNSEIIIQPEAPSFRTFEKIREQFKVCKQENISLRSENEELKLKLKGYEMLDTAIEDFHKNDI